MRSDALKQSLVAREGGLVKYRELVHGRGGGIARGGFQNPLRCRNILFQIRNTADPCYRRNGKS